MLEFRCPAGHRSESLEDRAAPAAVVACPTCGDPAARTVSAGHRRVPIASVERGSGRDRPPPSHALDTRPLAEGMPHHEWKARQSALKRDERLRQIRSLVE